MSVTTIRSQLKTVVDAVQTAQGEIAVTYDYQPSIIATTPAVCVIWDGSSDERGDTANNVWNSKFIIRTILEETSTFSTELTLLFSILDDLMEALRDKDNITLSGNAHKMLMVEVTPVLGATLGNMKVFYVDIIVEVRSLKAI